MATVIAIALAKGHGHNHGHGHRHSHGQSLWPRECIAFNWNCPYPLCLKWGCRGGRGAGKSSDTSNAGAGAKPCTAEMVVL